MIAIRLFLICLLVIFTSSCVTRQVQTLSSLPLPADQSSSCCWQALQQLEITYDKKTYNLTGALAQTRAGVTLVLLDPFGRRLLSINKQGETITSYRSPELPEGLPERFLLASSMLVWWPLANWQDLIATQKDWQINMKDSDRILSYRNHPMVRASYGPNSSAPVNGMSADAIGKEVLLKHERQPLTIKVTTQSFDKLDGEPR